VFPASERYEWGAGGTVPGEEKIKRNEGYFTNELKKAVLLIQPILLFNMV